MTATEHPLVLISSSKQVVAWNAAFQTLSGHPPGHLRRYSADQIFPGLDLSSLLKDLQKISQLR